MVEQVAGKRKVTKRKAVIMSRRRGVLHALLRREKGRAMANDHRDLSCFVEDRTAVSCFSEKRCSLPGSPRSTFLVCFSLDKSKMASTHGDHSIRITDSFTGECMRTLVGHPRTPWCITFNPSSNNLLASGCLAGEVRVWDLMGGSEVYTPPDRAAIASIAFHPTDSVLLIATSNKLYFWKWDQPQPFACLQTNYTEEKVRLVKFSPLGDYILTGITNLNNTETNEQGNRTQASVDQLLQSVSCTQLDSDQVSQYVMQQTARGGQSTSTSRDRPSTSNTQPFQSYPVPPTNEDTGLSSRRRRRQTRNYRGVFAIFRARDRDSGGWNVDTSEVDSDPTDVGRSNILFNPPSTTESMSIGRVGGPTRSVSSLSSSSSSSSSSPSSSSVESSPSVEHSSSSLPFSTSALSTVTGDSSAASGSLPSSRISNFSNNLLQSNTSGSRNDNISQSISILPMEMSSQSESHSHVSVDMVGSDSVQYGSSTDPDSEEGNQDNRYVSGVGSVINVRSASSRTSYVTHGSNHSSSLSTLSNQEGSGTAIATATARTFRHVHTAVVIANGNEEGPQLALRTAINRAIAGAFAGSGEGAVASNIINTTHRLQLWDYSKLKMPNLKDTKSNVIVPCCKIHNDASCDMSADGTLLAAFVPSVLGFPNDGMLAVYSLKTNSFGQCLFTKKFGPNAISISISPLNTHVVVGLASRHIQWHLTSQQMMAQVFKLTPNEGNKLTATELKMPIHSIVLNEEDLEGGAHVSVNAAFWHPVVGCGLVYGTNRGDLRMRQFGVES